MIHISGQVYYSSSLIQWIFPTFSSSNLPFLSYTLHIDWAVLVSAKLRQKKKKNPLAHYQNVSKMITSSTLLETLPAYLVLTGFLMCPVKWWVCWPRLASARITGYFPCGHLSCSTLAWACLYHGHRAPREQKLENLTQYCHTVISSFKVVIPSRPWVYCWWWELQLPDNRCKYWEKWPVIFAVNLW